MCMMLLPVLVKAQSGEGSGTSGDILSILTDEENENQVSVEVDSLLVAHYNKLITRNMKANGTKRAM